MNRKKVIAALASVAALASLAACGGVKDGGAATGNTITVGTTDKITSLDPAGSYDNGSYAVQIQVFPSHQPPCFFKSTTGFIPPINAFIWQFPWVPTRNGMR